MASLRRPLTARAETQLSELLKTLDDESTRGVLLVGAAGTGKTTLLEVAYERLQRPGVTTPILIRGSRLPGIQSLGAAVLKELDRDRPVDGLPAIRSSSRSSFDESLDAFRSVSDHLVGPVLLLDDADQMGSPSRIGPAVRELVERLPQWKFVIASRLSGDLDRSSVLSNFARVDVGHDLEMPEKIWGETDRAPDGSRMSNRVRDAIEQLPIAARRVVDRLAVLGSDDAEGLQLVSGMRPEEWNATLDRLTGLGFVRIGGTVGHPLVVRLAHEFIRVVGLFSLITRRPFTLDELVFGSEEGETDSLLNPAYVVRPDVDRIVDGRATVVVGARGSGKSALLRRLVDGGEELADGATAVALRDVGRALHSLTPREAWGDREQLRAAWLLLVAGEVASSLPGPASPDLLRAAKAILKALGRSPKQSRLGLALAAIGRFMGGSSISFAVGPVNLEARLPTGVTSLGTKSVDVVKFLSQSDQVLRSSGRKLMCLIDQTDEVEKFDRAKQEAALQALLQAEKEVRALDTISAVVFVRTDLFDVFDIQEKNKLISRTLRLEWNDDDWIQVLVERLVANSGLESLAKAVSIDIPEHSRAVLRALFPPQVEDRPVDLWLIDSLSNGKGDISPRLAVLLLHLTRERSRGRDEKIVSTPIFSEASLTVAMTALSKLAFEEVVNDFKVATAFVRNSRAAGIREFEVSEVRALFDESEGSVSRQINELEALGYLSRRVIDVDGEPRVRFHVPPLYCRAWGS